MHLTLDRPKKGIISIVAKLLEGEALEEGEEFEYIPVESETEGIVGPQFSTPKKGDDPVIPQLVEHFKSLQTSELKQIMTALNREMDARHIPQESPSKPGALGSHQQDVSSILHSLIKEGILRTNIPKLSVFSGERLKRVGIIWTMVLWATVPQKDLQRVCLEGRDPKIIEGAAAVTVCNTGLDATLDTIIKKLSIIYNNVKSYDILMGDFYHTDRGRMKQSPPLPHA